MSDGAHNGFVQHSDMISVPLVTPHIPLATHGGSHRGGGRAVLVPTLIQELTHTNLIPPLPLSSQSLRLLSLQQRCWDFYQLGPSSLMA